MGDCVKIAEIFDEFVWRSKSPKSDPIGKTQQIKENQIAH